jgi:hypothetical protein
MKIAILSFHISSGLLILNPSKSSHPTKILMQFSAPLPPLHQWFPRFLLLLLIAVATIIEFVNE